MPNMTISTDAGEPVYSERVLLIHLDNDVGACQLIERICWALEDAERREHGEPAPLPIFVVPESTRAVRAGRALHNGHSVVGARPRVRALAH